MNDGHERGRKEREQQVGVAELRAGLNVGSDTRRIVVGCTGYKTGAQTL